jgi:hypothetical protein
MRALLTYGGGCNSSPTMLAIGVLDNVSVGHWFRLGRTRLCFGDSAVVLPPELLVKSHSCGATGEARPYVESSRRADSESGLRVTPRGTRHFRCFASRWCCWGSFCNGVITEQHRVHRGVNSYCFRKIRKALGPPCAVCAYMCFAPPGAPGWPPEKSEALHPPT